MGREIRRVPPNWQHPKRKTFNRFGSEVESFQPLYNQNFADAMEEWYCEWQKWQNGDRGGSAPGTKFHEWHGSPPDPEYYHHELNKADCTWYQVYETVSEGTPVTPPFATKEELVQYLVENGDFWDQKRGHGGWCLDNAQNFVKCEFSPSMIFENGKLLMPRDGA